MLQPSDEIKSKLDIVDVIRDYIQLKAAGVNFRARCPFHREKTPSFMVSPEKQIWHCFGCGKGGDIFSFVQEIEGIDFVESLRVLAPKAGVTLKRQDPKLTTQRNRLLDILELSRKYYHKVLMESDQAKYARDYLEKRGLTEDTIEEWQIGYSPDGWENICNFLREKGFSENEIFLAGMSIKSNNRPGFYDRFRDRIMFPINDTNGSTVAFSARVNPAKEDKEKMGKYINSPQTLIYDKSKIIFGLDKAKMEIKAKDLAIITEGQMDVITAHQADFKNVVASSGTALTQEQTQLLKRFTPNIALAFDMDKAGSLAADRGIREAMQAEMNIKVVELGEGKDPDECIRNNPEDWKNFVEAAKPMMQYYFDKTFSGLDLDKIEDKRKSVQILLPVISKIGNAIEQDYWLKILSEKIDTEENLLRETLKNINQKQKRTKNYNEETQAPVPSEPKMLSRDERLSELLLSLMFKFTSLLEYTTNQIQIDQVAGEENRLFYKNLIFYYNNIINSNFFEKGSEGNTNTIDYNNFKDWLESENTSTSSTPRGGQAVQANEKNSNNQLQLLDKLVILGDKEFYDFLEAQAKKELINIILYLKKSYLINRMKEIEKLISQYEKEKNIDATKELLEEFKVLSDELKEIGN